MTDPNLISLQPGTVIAGKYEVIKCLGAGSMGLVYSCRHRELTGHMVAVKVLFPEVAADKIAVARFKNEIFASYGVSHPNVVRAYEYIKDGDLVAYTMEFVSGGALSDKLEDRESRIAIKEVIYYLMQMCAGVQAIHDAGIVHRDLKPENILITKEGTVKIADFGIARTGHGPKLTEHGGVVGTIDYVSPEYVLNSQVDWRSDIYALGILAYEMLCGESPFKGDSVYAIMTQRIKSDPVPPRKLRPDIPQELEDIVFKAMARDPEARYQSASEMLSDLQKVAGDSLDAQLEKSIRGASLGDSSQATPGYAKESKYIGPKVDLSKAEPAKYDFLGENKQPTVSSQDEELVGDFYNDSGKLDDTLTDIRVGPMPAGFDLDGTLKEPVKMESVLSERREVWKSWEHQRSGDKKQSTAQTDRLGAQVSAASSGRASDRLMPENFKAHNLRARSFGEGAIPSGSRSLFSDSLLIDLMILFVAIIIGVGVGFFAIQKFWPNLFSKPVEEIRYDSTFTGE
ncbi:MAG TPA: serine/threonine-protein kinase [Oligoflexia bacterium]|nr:serine/threonine-protein kinase [Oligoflexia bacterium]HMP27539.1 serine/threonine-protein kinase [Oligoflexia bacterium]